MLPAKEYPVKRRQKEVEWAYYRVMWILNKVKGKSPSLISGVWLGRKQREKNGEWKQGEGGDWIPLSFFYPPFFGVIPNFALLFN